MAEFLRQPGYRALEAGTTVEVTAFTAVLPPALLVIGIFLPAPSGADLIRQLRGMPTFTATPILTVSAAGTETIPRLALEAGSTAFLEKPFDCRAFLDTDSLVEVWGGQGSLGWGGVTARAGLRAFRAFRRRPPHPPGGGGRPGWSAP